MEEVQSPIDLNQLSDARAWAAEVMEKRPYRTDFFKEFESQLIKHNAASVLELGSGPGFLAAHLVNAIPDIEYTAYDFSDAMHLLAKERLGLNAGKVKFITGSFKEQNWEIGLGKYNAVVTMQAAHEVRHKAKVLDLFKSAKNLLTEGGIFLYCDHFYGEAGMQNNNLYMSTLEQEQCLEQAGFSGVNKLLSIGTLNLWFSQKYFY
jgi:cyclopropane fatty-acyl-phospholipid synthase-like methyltransferase